MHTNEIENQKVMIETLKSEMQAGYVEIDADRWSVQRGYIPTCEYYNRTGEGTWTEGVDFVVLDNEHIAYRLNGDYRDTGEWVITDTDADEFVGVVIADAENWLVLWKEQEN